MKFRTDFVTNSSSSSFICSFAKISNMNTAQEIISKFNLNRYLISGKDLKEQLDYTIDIGAEWAGINLKVNEEDIDEDALYIYYHSSGGAGDEDEHFDDGFGSLEYDVTLEDFQDNEQEIFNNITEEHGFSDIQNGFGAGRE